jgi:hypothetical protein
LGLYQAKCFPTGRLECRNFRRKVDDFDSGAVRADKFEAARLCALQSTEIIDRWSQLNFLLDVSCSSDIQEILVMLGGPCLGLHTLPLIMGKSGCGKV